MAFDPITSQRPPRRRQRGSRFRLLLVLAALLLVGGIAVERWLVGWRLGGPDERRDEVQETQAVVPSFTLPPPRLEPAAFSIPPPPAPPPPPEPVQARRPPAREPRLPTKIAFDVQVEAPAMDWFADGRRPMLAKGCALRPGATVIPAVLETVIESEVAGQAIAQVSEDVYDVDRVGRLLIPAGTKVVGTYKKGGELSFERRRLDIVWTEMTLPDGAQLALADASGMDVAGSMGMGGEVRTRWGDLIATAALLTVFDAVQRGTVADDASLLDSTQAAASRQGAQLGREVTRKVLDWEPTIRIPAGTPITISPQKTVQVC